MKKIFPLFAFLGALLSSPSRAVQAPPLGTAADYVIIGGKSLGNSGLSLVEGNVALSPGDRMAGFEYVLKGRTHAGDSAASVAQKDLQTARAAVDSQDCAGNAESGKIRDAAFRPGLHCLAAPASLGGTITFDALGDPRSVFILKTAGHLQFEPGAEVELLNGAQSCNIFWKTDDAVAVGESAVVKGTVMALSSVDVRKGARVDGRILSRFGDVRLDNNQVQTCSTLIRESSSGRLIGSASLPLDGAKADYVFHLSCRGGGGNNLEVSWKGNKFELDRAVAVSCVDDPSIGPNPALAGFDTMKGAGTGSLNGKKGYSVRWTFTDAGEPGARDFAEILITDFGRRVLSVSGPAEGGGHSARGE